jgi:integrase
MFVCSLKWAHNLKGYTSPTDNTLVVETLNGLKRKLAKQKVAKDPFTIDHINQMIDEVDDNSNTDIRNTCIIVLAYYAFLRVDELKNIRTSSLILHEDHLEIRIKKSKTDQLRQGNVVVVARLGNKYCPIRLLQKYAGKVGINLQEDQFLFRAMSYKNKTAVLEKTDKALIYTRFRDIVKNKATQLGLDAKRFATHSMRAGGASAAANSSINERLFQRHGRWSSVEAKNMYVVDSLQNRLKVSKAIS